MSGQFTTQMLSLIISKEFRAPASQIKNLTFDQYLNLILRIAEFKEPIKYRANPKAVLINMVEEHLIPLIDSIKNAVEEGLPGNLHMLYTVSDQSLKTIVYDYDSKAIFKDIAPLLSLIYKKYFK